MAEDEEWEPSAKLTENEKINHMEAQEMAKEPRENLPLLTFED